MRKALLILALLAVLVLVISCAAPAAPTAAPVVVQQTVVVKETQIVAGTPQVVERVVTATPPPPTTAPTKAPVGMKDTIVLAMSQEPDTLFPGIGSMMARSLVLRGLLSECTGQDNTAKWVPIACQSIPTLDNGGAKFVGDGADKHLEVTFKFISGLKWHDGTPVTAKDQVYGWKLIMDPKFPYVDRSFPYKVFDVSAVDDQTWLVKFMSENQALAAAAGTLKGAVDFSAFKSDYGPDGMGFDTWKGKGPVVDPLYWTADFAYPSQVLSKLKPEEMEKSDFAKKPVGNGPYKIKEWQPAQQITLEAVADHPLKPKIKTIIFRFITDASAELAAIQKGEIDGGTQIGLEVDSAPELDKLSKQDWRVDYTPGYQWEHIDLNTTAFPFDDVKVRQALAYATNKKEVVDQLYYGKVKPAYSWLPDFHWAYDASFSQMYGYDVNKAKDLLKQAGWDCAKNPCQKKVTEGGKEVTKNLEFTLVTTDRKDRQALAQVLQSQWKKANFGVNLQFLYGRGLFATCTGGAGGPLNCRQFQAGMYTWLSNDDPDQSPLYSCKSTPSKDNNWSGQNYPGVCDKKLDELLVKGASDAEIAISPAKRKPIYVDAQKIWLDLMPVIPIKANANVTVWSTHLKGATGVPTSYGETWNMHAWEWVP